MSDLGARVRRAAFATLGVTAPFAVARAQATPFAAQATSPPSLVSRTPVVAVTKHTGVVGAQAFSYSAIVEEHVLSGPDSVPNASLVTIAYVRDDVADASKRPVMFVFNGGPGSSSSPLHMRGLGPRLTSSDGTGTTENPESILDVVDLVFIDPVGTGFSRPYTTGVGRAFYWSQTGDATSVATAIEHWLAVHNRARSPRYLAGESYGTARAGYLMSARPQLRFDGARNSGRRRPNAHGVGTACARARRGPRRPRA